MSETSSDTESSCGWTIISNEGSDIETLGLETELLAVPAVKEAELQDQQASLSNAQCVEEKVAESLDETLEEPTVDETLCASEPRDSNSKGKQHVALLSSSDHSDIVTLGDLKEGEHVEVEGEEEAAANEEFYLGTSCSSQYAFTAAETVFLAKQPTVTKSSSSEDEAGQSPGAVVRRRRLRKNTASVVTEPEEDVLGSGRSEEEEEEVKEQNCQQQEEEEVGSLDYRMRGQGGNTLNSCILISLVIAISIGYGHFYGTVQVQVRQKTVDKVGVNELDVVKDLIEQHVGEQAFTNQIQTGYSGLDEKKRISMLTEMIEKVKKENQDLIIRQEHIQAQRDDLEMLLKQKTEERTNIGSQQQTLTAENQLLKTSLEREEKSLSTLQKELRNLRSEIRDREASGHESNSLLSDIQGLKDQLDEEKQLIKSLHSQREDMVAEAQTLREKLDKERTVTGELRRELNMLRNHIKTSGKEAGSDAEELQSRLIELEKKLSFEQQRSDLWERLYVETKDDRAKGDTESKVRWTKEGVAGKVKQTFDAVKNSTKAFVHHHKEQIKKAKEAVKENLKKFSDSIKSTFRHFKRSASTFINKASGFSDQRQAERNRKESWKHRFHKSHHKHQRKPDDSFHNNPDAQKSEYKDHDGQDADKRNSKGCSGIFDCAYQESKVREPIRADEFYPLLQSYVHQEADHFHHWKELESFISDFFHDGVFIHDQMLFTDFVSVVGNYLTDIHQSEHRGAVFRDLGDFVDRHFGEASKKSTGPNGPFEGPDSDSRGSRAPHPPRRQQRARPRPHSERKWSRYGRNADRHTADVKVELGPLPFDPKY
uniref:Cell cycle progression 1 n=1 Tax=Gasterosteus aculeatus aculeatus TaxID=481459 RepID=G3PTI4_GASAC|nr:cell cycle progression protein 1 [Gasterosteus aculeatus aculeatus]XP_040057724.1 cell cycle progression protein 1 [Gasterosteus aculeatus aculeatus]XP_040057732.1 cell cycle progression protein 1 [Gasterosteus aculeatus aculeatus]